MDNLINGIPLEIKKKTLENKLILEESKINDKLKKVRSENRPDKEEQIFILTSNMELLKELRSVEIETTLDYDYVSWCYNGGFFRNLDDIANKKNEYEYDKDQIRINNIRNSEEYKKGYHPYIFFLSWLFTPPLIIGFVCEGKCGFFYGLMSGVAIFSYTFYIWIILAAIATLIYNSCHSSKFNIPSDPVVSEAVVGATVAGITIHHVNNIKHKKELEKEKQNI